MSISNHSDGFGWQRHIEQQDLLSGLIRLNVHREPVGFGGGDERA